MQLPVLTSMLQFLSKLKQPRTTFTHVFKQPHNLIHATVKVDGKMRIWLQNISGDTEWCL